MSIKIAAVDDNMNLPAAVRAKVAANLADPATVEGAQMALKLGVAALPAALGNSLIAPPITKYAGVRAKSWDQALCLYNGESAALTTIRGKVAAARNGVTAAAIAAVGDSKTAGTSGGISMAEASYPGRLAEYLGATDGMIYANPSDSRWSITGWTSQSSTSRNYVNLEASQAGTVGTATLTTRHAHTGFTVYGYISGSAGGVMTITVDGGTPTTWTVPGASPWRAYSVTGLTNATHTIQIQHTALPGQPAALLGIKPTYSTPGLTISNAGRPSSSALDWRASTWIEVYPSTFAVGNGALERPDIAITGIGTNTNTSTLDDITGMVSAINDLDVPQLLVAFGGLPDTGHYNAKRKRLYEIADSLDLPLVDFTQVIGHDVKAAANGLMHDAVHENARGYALEAAAVAHIIGL